MKYDYQDQVSLKEGWPLMIVALAMMAGYVAALCAIVG
jgi:uncharacterized protein YodC (DUF2158 family)